MRARTNSIIAAIWLASLLAACRENDSPPDAAAVRLNLTSTAFANGEPIPARCALDTQNLSPTLQWSGVPSSAKSLVLICEDPDATMGTWTHWVLYDLPPDSTTLGEGVPNTPELANGAKQGINDFARIGYGGPQPPPGKPHRYSFKIYALDVKTGLNAGVKKEDLLKAMHGHIVAEGELMGTYQRE